MAGPCATILLPAVLSPADREAILREISAIADSMEGADFWIDGHPFIAVFHGASEDAALQDAYRDEVAEYAGIQTPAGSPIRDFFGFCAMVNGDADHAELARLCIRFAERSGGLINFGHSLDRYTADRAILDHPGLDFCEGRHVFGPDLLQLWLQHPDFRMVK
ncbi:MAG: DUF6368 family protein [Alphaproteobacteria bacterium]|nr:DUF6368 family protein [Alphaproteobacteria bacterium]